MNIKKFHHTDSVADSDLVALGTDPPDGRGKKIIKVSDQTILKFGPGVREEEAKIQQLS